MSVPNLDEAGNAIRLFGALAAIGAAVMTALVTLWRNLTGRIAAIDERVAHKADKSDLMRALENQAELFRQQREDKGEILGAIGKLTGTFHEHQISFVVHAAQVKARLDAREKLIDERSKA